MTAMRGSIMLPLLFCNLSEVLKMIMSFSRRSLRLRLSLSPSHHQTMNCINVRAASSEQQQLSRHAIH